MEGAAPKVGFAIVGSGWRAEFYLRVARALPSRFEVCGVVVRSAASAADLAARWGVTTFPSAESLVKVRRPDFLVVCVAADAAPQVIAEASAQGLPLLVETPPALDVDGLTRLHALVQGGARIQVAEQYHLQPMLAAQIAISRSGRLGEVSEAGVSVAHDYHGMSVMRRILGVGFDDATIHAGRYESPLIAGPTRAGDPVEEQVVTSIRLVATVDFGGRVGSYDFAPQHYRSWIRSTSVVVRGSRGEIRDAAVRYLDDFRTPMLTELQRVSAGEGTNTEGQFLRGIVAAGEWVYRNEFQPARLFDDELAIAACLQRMGEYAAGGAEFYSLAEASQDQYLQLMVGKAADDGQPVHTTRQVWADD